MDEIADIKTGFLDRLSSAVKILRGTGPVLSVQPRFSGDEVIQRYYSILTSFALTAKEAPEYGDPMRDWWLRQFVFRRKAEPILVGAIYSLTAKMRSLGWKITGPKDQAKYWTQVLQEADYGDGWDPYVAKVFEDFQICDGGAYTEYGYEYEGGPVAAIFHLDSVRCYLTGNPEFPVQYNDTLGEFHLLGPRAVGHFASMPNPDEEHFGRGFSAVSRALRAVQVLVAIHQYEEEKLSHLPPAGLATISGLTLDEVKASFDLYDAMRESGKNLRFAQVLWFVAQSLPSTGVIPQIKVELVPFSTLPDHFDKAQAVELYVRTLAVDFGVDIAEFWQTLQPAQKLKGEVVIQERKAKGKGTGEMITCHERLLNYEVLSPGVKFEYNLQDSEDILRVAEVQGANIINIKNLYETVRLDGMGLIDRNEARHLLVHQQIIPESFVPTLTEIVAEVEGRTKDKILTLDQDGSVVSAWSPDGFRLSEQELEFLVRDLEAEIEESRTR